MEFKILLVDDEKELTSTITPFLLDRGYRVVQAGSGDEAIDLLSREPVDLMILDLKMPGVAGTEVLKHARRHAPSTQVVVLTGYPEREQEVRQIGCDGFVAKPLAMENLLTLLESLLNRKDDDELKSYTMGAKVQQAYPGEPLAVLLLFEPIPSLSQLLLRFLDNSQQAQGVYKVELASNAEGAYDSLFAIHPDIILMDLMTVQNPGEAVRRLLSCPVQPKDYIFYMHPKSDKEMPTPLPGKRWEGNPWQPQDLQTLAQLIRKTALEHGLVKR